MKLLCLLAGLAALTSAAPTAADIQKRAPGNTVLYPNGLPTNEGLNKLPTSAYTRKYWTDTTKLSAGCKSHGANNKCASANIDIFDVTFADSPGHSWVLCRCKNNSKVSEAVRTSD